MQPKIHSRASDVADLILNRTELERALDQKEGVSLSVDQKDELIKILENRKAVQFDFSDYEAMAVSGTGGSRIDTINVSSLACLLTASLLAESASSTALVKTGTRSSRPGRKGTYDIMKMLNFRMDTTRESAAYDIDHYGISFVASTRVYPWLGYLDLVDRLTGQEIRDTLLFDMDRDETGIRRRFIGVTSPDLRAFACNYDPRAYESICLIHGRCGSEAEPYDEMSICGSSDILIATQGGDMLFLENMTPENFGLSQYSLKDVVIENAEDAYAAINLLLEGKPFPPAWEDLVVLNAAVLLSAMENIFGELPAKADRLKAHFRKNFSVYLRKLSTDEMRRPAAS